VDDGTAGYLHAPGLVSKVTASGATDGLTDVLGSVRGTTDASGTLTGRRSYEAFGSTLASSGTSLVFGFTGAPSDATGLVDLRARSLDPVSGRFLSPDSVIPNAPGTQGYSGYAYVANNPMNWTDPTGHSVNLLAQDAATIMATQMGPLMVATLALCGGAALTSAGIAIPVCEAAGIIAVFMFTMPLLICALTQGCMQAAWDFFTPITDQGSSGPVVQPTDPLDAVDDHPQTPPEPQPLPSVCRLNPLACLSPPDGKKPVVIGENAPNTPEGETKRVDRAARKFDADVFPMLDLPASDFVRLEHNRNWIRLMMAERRTIIDVGPSADRVSVGGLPGYPECSSPYYCMEVYETRYYPVDIRSFPGGGWRNGLRVIPDRPWWYDAA